MGRAPEEPLDDLRGMKKLSAMELEFMRFIWEHPEGISSKEIYERFPQARGTISTILFKISEKGYVQKTQNGRHHFYTANISEAEYEQALFKQQLKKNFGSASFERFVAAFCGKKNLTEKQLGKVNELLKELEHDMEDE